MSHESANGIAATSTLRRYLDVVARRRWLVLVCIVVPIAVAVAYGAHKSHVYQDRAQVQISRSSLANELAGLADPSGQTNEFNQIVQTQADIASSPNVAKMVLVAVPHTGLTWKEFLSQASVTPVANADLLTFHVASPDPGVATTLTTAYARQFVAYRAALDTSALNKALGQLTTRIAQLQAAPSPDRGVLSQLLSREQQLRTLAALQTSNAYVVSTASGAIQISPNPEKYVVVALFIGLLLAVALMAAYESLDTRVRRPEEVEEALKVPLLGHIGPPPSDLHGSLLMLSRPRSPEAEGFRGLRVSLELALIDRNVRTLAISSALEREGKSVTVSNLGVAIALTGANVVIVDLDLRRPTIGQKFDHESGPGVTDVARGRIPMHAALQPIDLPDVSRPGREGDQGTLSILRAGPPPPDPGEFILSPSVLAMLAELRETFDMVLIDTPPMLQVGDTFALASVIDGLCLVTRLPDLRRPALQALARIVQTIPSSVVGYVTTGTGHLSGYGYGYGYGYGEYTADAVRSGIGRAGSAPADPDGR